MANKKIINSRMTQKIDTTANWEKATNFIPLKGEIVYYQDENQPIRYKVGDGVIQPDGSVMGTKINDLPFANEVVTKQITGEKGIEVTASVTASLNEVGDFEFNWELPDGYNFDDESYKIQVLDNNEEIIYSFSDLSGEGNIYPYGSYDYGEDTISIKLVTNLEEKGLSLSWQDEDYMILEGTTSIAIKTSSTYQEIITPVTELIAGVGTSISNINGQTTISTDLVELTDRPSENPDNKAPNAQSVSELLTHKLEGFSSKYNVSQKGWHRVLNTIRGNGGQLNLTLAYGNFNLQSINIDLQGFVKYSKAPLSTPSLSQNSIITLLSPPSQADEKFNCRITKVRIGYPTQEGLSSIDSNSPVNCYIDAYFDWDYPSGSKALTCHYTGKSLQHHCYVIDTETITQQIKVDSEGNQIDGEDTGTLNKGMYGEDLEFYTLSVDANNDKNFNEQSIIAKKIYAEEVSKIEEVSSTINGAKGNLGVQPVKIEATIASAERTYYNFFRKYNMIPLGAFQTSSNNFYDWDIFYSLKASDGDKLIRPFQQKNNLNSNGGRHSLTRSGALIFNGVGTSFLRIFVTAKSLESSAPAILTLTPGTYITNLRLWPVEGSSSLPRIAPSSTNPFPQWKFSINETTPIYMARLETSANIDYTGKSVIPFLCKLSDTAEELSGAIADNTITYNLSNEAQIEYDEDGVPFIENVETDKVIVYDSRNGESITITDFNDLYSSRKLQGNFEFSRIIDFKSGKDTVDDIEYEGLDSIAGTYQFCNTKTANYYDTVALTPVSGGAIDNNDIPIVIGKRIKEEEKANIIIDSELNSTSTNPVQNKVIANELNNCIKREIIDADEEHEKVELTNGVKVSSYYNGDGSGGYDGTLIIPHHYADTIISDGTFYMGEDSEGFISIQINPAGSDGAIIESSEAVKQAFKDWLGIS